MLKQKTMIFHTILICTLLHSILSDVSLEELRLPDEHIPYFLNNNPEYKKECSMKEDCLYKDLLNEEQCWGYEDKCDPDNRMSNSICPGDAKGWVKNKKEQVENFWNQADFGYIKEKKKQLTVFCKSKTKEDSSLECVEYTRFCRGKNIFMDFTTAKLKDSRDRYREDVFTKGQLGGHCKFNKEKFMKEGEHKSALQSWFGELQHFNSLDKRPLEAGMCDIVVEKPAYIMKLDAGVNMYHHFCDFFNLYISQHLNNSFGLDVQLVMWDSSGMMYGDFFHDTWQAFSIHPIIPLRDWDGKKVCFKDAVFPLLPRMRYGHFYNMPLCYFYHRNKIRLTVLYSAFNQEITIKSHELQGRIPGCERSSMYRAFSHHLIKRLNLTQEGPLKDKIRVTLLSRSSKYRRILNEDKLVKALKAVKGYEVTVVDFNPKIPFLQQIPVTHNSDIFMGMHGAGLTHMLFQPDWGVIFEIYNCDDENCYKDLARLRGLKYMTWENTNKLIQEDEGHHPTLGAHKKFTNYEFNVKEFLRLVANAALYVRSHPTYMAAKKTKYQKSTAHGEL